MKELNLNQLRECFPYYCANSHVFYEKDEELYAAPKTTKERLFSVFKKKTLKTSSLRELFQTNLQALLKEIHERPMRIWENPQTNWLPEWTKYPEVIPTLYRKSVNNQGKEESLCGPLAQILEEIKDAQEQEKLDIEKNPEACLRAESVAAYQRILQDHSSPSEAQAKKKLLEILYGSGKPLSWKPFKSPYHLFSEGIDRLKGAVSRALPIGESNPFLSKVPHSGQELILSFTQESTSSLEDKDLIKLNPAIGDVLVQRRQLGRRIIVPYLLDPSELTIESLAATLLSLQVVYPPYFEACALHLIQLYILSNGWEDTQIERDYLYKAVIKQMIDTTSLEKELIFADFGIDVGEKLLNSCLTSLVKSYWLFMNTAGVTEFNMMFPQRLALDPAHLIPIEYYALKSRGLSLDLSSSLSLTEPIYFGVELVRTLGSKNTLIQVDISHWKKDDEPSPYFTEMPLADFIELYSASEVTALPAQYQNLLAHFIDTLFSEGASYSIRLTYRDHPISDEERNYMHPVFDVLTKILQSQGIPVSAEMLSQESSLQE